MFKLPSFIIRQAGATTFRQYASVVFRCLQQSEDSQMLNLVSATFVHATEASQYEEQIKQRINATLPCTQDKEECICVLPPLFLHSAEDSFNELTPHLFLVCCKTGPIFPFVRLHSSESILGDSTLLDALFILYETLSDVSVTKANIQSIFDATRKQKQEKQI